MGDVEPVKVLYVSSDETIASVDDGGLVTAHKEGKAILKYILKMVGFYRMSDNCCKMLLLPD